MLFSERLLKLLGGHGDAGAPDTKHLRQEIVRHREGRGVDAVVRHQQPAGETLWQIMARVAGGCLRGLVVECLHVAQQEQAQAQPQPAAAASPGAGNGSPGGGQAS